MVMAFNPDDPHDGQATDGFGFTYRMIHIGPELVSRSARRRGRRPGRAAAVRRAVLSDPVLADRLRRLHVGLLGQATALRRDELLAAVVLAAARLSRGPSARTSSRPAQLPARAWSAGRGPPTGSAAAGRRPAVRRTGARPDRGPLPGRPHAGDLATATGRSRFAVHRAFTHVYGMPPSDYQRQLRLARPAR